MYNIQNQMNGFKKIGDYSLQEEIGKGNFSTVYLGVLKSE